MRKRGLSRATIAAVAMNLITAGALAPSVALAFVRGRSNHIEKHVDPSGERFDVEKLLKIISEEKIESIEALLPRLPKHLRDRYVLMFKSRSLQQATFQRPRAILFEGDASLIVAFGASELRGGNSLETIQFREATKRWEFREVSFQAGQPARVSLPNPRRCLECHQGSHRQDVDPRPNWEPYNLWPGAYAGVDGESKKKLDVKFEGRKFKPQDASLIAEQVGEFDQFNRFMSETKTSHPRYQWLGNFVERSVLDLTDLIVGANDVRVARLAESTPDWDIYKPIFTNAIFCSSAWLSQRWTRPAPLEAFVPLELPKEIREIHAAQAIKMAASQSIPYEGPSPSQQVDLFFEGRGIDTSDWSTDFKTGGRFAFEGRFGSPSEPLEQFRNALIERFGLTQGQACRESRDQTAALELQWRASNRFTQIARDSAARLLEADVRAAGAGEALRKRCASCHVEGESNAPRIPFNDSQALKLALAKQGYQRGSLLQEIEYRMRDVAPTEEQMPPTGSSLPWERERLVDYLRSL